MNISMTNLAAVSLYAAVLGLILGASFDVIRILRVALGVSSYGKRKFFSKIYSSGIRNVFSFKRSRIVDSVIIGIGDLVFFIYAAVAFSIFLYRYNFGRFRWFILLSAAGGFIAYYFSIGKLVIRFSDAISQFVMLGVNILLFLLCLPFRLLFKSVKKLYTKLILPIITKMKNKVDKRRHKRYTDKCIKKIPQYVDFDIQINKI